MFHRLALLAVAVAILAGCNNPTPVGTSISMVTSTATVTFAATVASTSTVAAPSSVITNSPPTATPTAAAAPTAGPTVAATVAPPTRTSPAAQPTSSPAPAVASTAPAVSGPPAGDYLDDRSSPDQLIRSLFNAVSHQQYSRAYSYWSPNGQVTSFDQFALGYAQTALVQVKFGTITSSGAAGSIYYGVPTALLATTTSGAAQSFAGCYTVRLAQPGNFGAPPIQPMAIEKGSVNVVPARVDPATLLGNACADQPGMPVTPQVPNSTEIGASRYVDDRSTAESTLRSLFNSVNRHEYVRAYSYWNDVPDRQPYSQFEQGYVNTLSVQLTAGVAVQGAAAGNLYWRVPVALVAQTTGGQTQTFVGCYTLHLPQPPLQAIPPYHPTGIEQASVQQVANNANITSLMGQACPR